jgi:ribose 1,5-bisphosphokinase PhnN
VGHDIQGEKHTGLYAVPIAIDQQVDAGAAVLSDQVDMLDA